MNKKGIPQFDGTLEALDDLLGQAGKLSKRQRFINRFGEDPVDVMGQDWEDHIEEYIDNANKEDERIDK
jgi:hypothetical protein